MKLIFLASFMFVGILGEVPEEQQSSIAITTDDFSGPWLLLYFGVPDDLSPYKNTKCLNAWAKKVNETYLTAEGTNLDKDDKANTINFDVTIESLPDNKFAYIFTTDGQSTTVKIIDFDKYKYAAAITFINGKKYLYAYGRDPYILNECNGPDLLEKWLIDTSNSDKPSYKINPDDCKCVGSS